MIYCVVLRTSTDEIYPIIDRFDSSEMRNTLYEQLSYSASYRTRHGLKIIFSKTIIRDGDVQYIGIGPYRIVRGIEEIERLEIEISNKKRLKARAIRDAYRKTVNKDYST